MYGITITTTIPRLISKCHNIIIVVARTAWPRGKRTDTLYDNYYSTGMRRVGLPSA